MPDPFIGQLGFSAREAREYFLLGHSNSTTADWTPFVVPKNASMLYLVCVGGGGGGGGGFTAATATVKAGGSGGGSGAMSRLLIPARFLPKTLYLLAGSGGVGGTGSGVAGSSGNRSSINDTTNTLGTAANTILVSGTTAAIGGPAGTSAAGATAAGETAATTALSAFSGLGFWISIAGMTSSASSVTANPNPLTFGAVGIPVMGGCAGAGATAANAVFTGGSITGAGLVPSLSGGTGVAGGPGNPGSQGLFYPGRTFNPGWVSTGGTGGGSSATAGVGGVGGQGGPGSGGGGGGAGVTGAAGGAGGPGFVYIAWW